MKLKCDAVFEGGGVRGIGHIGAATAIEQAGYEFENLAGSSCGAIVAGLLAVGYNTTEIKEIMKTLDYTKFKQETILGEFGTAGKLLNVALKYGIYSTSYFEEWFEDLLKRKGKTTFGDIKTTDPSQEKYKYKLQVTASDITTQQLLTFPQDLVQFGIDIDTFSIAKAVKMSMSMPVYFMPYILTDADEVDHYIVDGGLLSNYPVWMLDDGTANPPIPTFGFKFSDNEEQTFGEAVLNKINIVSYLQLIVSTLRDATDNKYISQTKGDFQRSILIPVNVDIDGDTKKIKATDFSISSVESEKLFENGYNAGVKFLSDWDFEGWKTKFRN